MVLVASQTQAAVATVSPGCRFTAALIHLRYIAVFTVIGYNAVIDREFLEATC